MYFLFSFFCARIRVSKREPPNLYKLEKKEGFIMKTLWKMLDEYYRTFAR